MHLTLHAPAKLRHVVEAAMATANNIFRDVEDVIAQQRMAA